MPLNERHPDSVFFVCDEINGRMHPLGTTFLVGMPGRNGRWWRYFVTAKHVVASGVPTWIRFRLRGGGVTHEEVGRWIDHPNKDVDIAVTPCEPHLLDATRIWSWTEDWVWADRWSERSSMPLRLGELAFFVGLLTDVRTMVDGNIPMMRSGRIGAWYQRDVPVIANNFRHIEPCVHLLDSYSRGGFSGSPCWVDQAVPEWHDVGPPQEGEQFRAGLAINSLVALAGVVVGHFDAGENKDNAGIALVVPIEAVRETITQRSELVEWQERKEREADERDEGEKWDGAATGDSTSDESEYDRFKGLASKLVNTPKPEKKD